MKKLIAVAGIAGAGILAAACSSGPTTGTETWSGKQVLTPAQLANQNFVPTYPMTFTGPVHATATFMPPGGNQVHVKAIFKTTAGTLVANADIPGNGNLNPNPTSFDSKTCAATFDLNGTYTVDGMASTGSWKAATGHGTIKDVFVLTLPKNSSGACNEANNVAPVSGYTTLVVSGPVTVQG